MMTESFGSSKMTEVLVGSHRIRARIEYDSNGIHVGLDPVVAKCCVRVELVL